MGFPDTVRALAQSVPSVASPVSWETAVFGFSSVVAIWIGKKLDRMWEMLVGIDKKQGELTMTLHGAPEQKGTGGLVSEVRELKDAERMHQAIHDYHLLRIEQLERAKPKE